MLQIKKYVNDFFYKFTSKCLWYWVNYQNIKLNMIWFRSIAISVLFSYGVMDSNSVNNLCRLCAENLEPNLAQNSETENNSNRKSVLSLINKYLKIKVSMNQLNLFVPTFFDITHCPVEMTDIFLYISEIDLYV